ncbi:FAD-dependent monooxygenase [Lichenibacterium dinghuense]|uniref:FAD binding domain-containing protein n=1 Tax=Lichenibacterium dinghuense TaxID=2895977 RepID=UPI001F010A0B|nr:FAD-dependent monooxygenase [Lichenibacterium sp. 6Y81]
MAARRALVVGGSMSGLFVATALLQDGWDVQVFERSPVPLSSRGAGIIAQPQVRRTLGALGLVVPDGFGVDVSRRQTLDRAGRIVATATDPLIATSWNRLFGVLRAGFPDDRYHLDHDLAGLAEDEGGVTARFARQGEVRGDLVVGADGFRSNVRRLLFPTVEPLYAGYVAWRGLVAEEALPPDTHRDMFGHFSFGLPPDEQILGYPVAADGNEAGAGRGRYNFVWYRPAGTDDLARLLTDETGQTHDISIPPPLIARAVVDEMRRHADAVFAPQFRTLIRLTEQPFLQPIYDLEAPRMAEGRVALVGDAAFVARPHVGAGTAKACDDAMALAAALRAKTDPRAALARFAAERGPVGERIVAQGRHLGAYMTRDFATADQRLRAERHRSPEAVMAETALLHFLAA